MGLMGPTGLMWEIVDRLSPSLISRRSVCDGRRIAAESEEAVAEVYPEKQQPSAAAHPEGGQPLGQSEPARGE
jgi:hypothetical protein